VATREAVAFAKSGSGFSTRSIARKTAADVTTKIRMFVLRIRDEVAAVSQAFPIPSCSGSSARSEKKRGLRSFVAMGDASTLNATIGHAGLGFLLFLLTGTPLSRRKKARTTGTI
jgi:hypothetical protein